MHDQRTGLRPPLHLEIFATAAASSAFAPKPYTVSVGNATSPPARMIVRGFLNREAHLCRIAGGLAGLAPHQIGVDQRIQIAIQHAIHVADRPAWCDDP